MKRDPRIDAYIERARPFARPILRRLRAAVRAQLRDGVETLKWGMPAFTRNGRIVCGMAAFQSHCALWFWNSAKLRRVLPRKSGAMGQFGRITSARDQPSKPVLARALRAAVALNRASDR